MAETIHRDLKKEVGFLTIFDEALRKMTEIVDMPSRRASLLIRMILQNRGTLSKTRRPKFPELTDEEVTAIEAAVRSSCAIAEEGAGK